MVYRKNLFMIFSFALLQTLAEAKKDIPQEGYISNYSVTELGWRAVNYLSGNRSRKEDILAAIKNDDVEGFKKNFIKHDLVNQPEIVEELILNNKLRLLKLLDEEYNVDIKGIVEKSNNKRTLPYVLLQHHGAAAIEMKDYLKNLGIDINVTNEHGENLAMLAVTKKDKMLLQDLINKHDVDINAVNNNEDAVLHYTADVGNPEYNRCILAANPELNIRNNKGETAFFIATKKDFPEVLQQLSQAGADANIANVDGQTPGHLAISDSCSPKSAGIVFKTNLDPSITNNDGVSVEEKLRDEEFYACVLLPADVNKQTLQTQDKRCCRLSTKRALFRKSLRTEFMHGLDVKIEERNKQIEQNMLAEQERIVLRKKKLEEKNARLELEKEQLEVAKLTQQEELKGDKELIEILAKDVEEQEEQKTCESVQKNEREKIKEVMQNDPNQEPTKED